MRSLVLGRVVVVGILLLTGVGCYKHTYIVGAGAPDAALAHDEWRHHWLWGLINPDKELALAKVCTSGDATIDTEMTFLNGLVSALTSGIYSPTTVRVRCAAGSVHLELQPEDVARIVTDPRFLTWVAEDAPARLAEVRQAQVDAHASSLAHGPDQRRAFVAGSQRTLLAASN
jgi:hypothetical protein